MLPRKITVEEVGRPEPVTVPTPQRFDLQDALLTGGIVLSELAAAVIWWPAALILGSAFCFLFAFLIERVGSSRARKHGISKS